MNRIRAVRKLGEPAGLMTDRAYDNLKSAEIKLKISLISASPNLPL